MCADLVIRSVTSLLANQHISSSKSKTYDNVHAICVKVLPVGLIFFRPRVSKHLTHLV